MSILLTVMVVLAVALNVAGQVLLKWRIMNKDGLADSFDNKWAFISDLIVDPYIIGAFACVFGASILWIFCLSKVDLSLAYPFMGLSFVMILGLSAWLFGEALDVYKIVGVIMISSGVVISYISST